MTQTPPPGEEEGIVFSLTCPRQLDITPGAHPTRTYTSISGASRTRLFGSQPVGSSVRARFFCTSAEAAQVVADYHATYSGAEPIGLDPELFAGHEAIAAALPPLKWYMQEPELSPLFRDRVELSVIFEGRLEV
jgi:hypothetical protein